MANRHILVGKRNQVALNMLEVNYDYEHWFIPSTLLQRDFSSDMLYGTLLHRLKLKSISWKVPSQREPLFTASDFPFPEFTGPLSNKRISLICSKKIFLLQEKYYS